MKTLLSIFFIIALSFVHAQTAIIGTKSHSSKASEADQEPDNFGVIVRPPTVDTVCFVSDHCVIHKGTKVHSGHYSDTICDHWYYEENGYGEASMKRFHGKDVVLIGFKTQAIMNTNYNRFRSKSSNQEGSLLFWTLLSAGLGSLLILRFSKIQS